MMSSVTDEGKGIPLPLPPLQYISLYSEESIELGLSHKPPPLPTDTYTGFGRTFNVQEPLVIPLEEHGIKRLHPQHFDRRRELKKLNYSLMVNFLDLIDILVQCPDSPKRTEKIDDIGVLFIHMHHLINEYRPYQAYDTLRNKMKLQRRQRLETTIRHRKHIEEATDILQRARENLPIVVIDTVLMENVENQITGRKPEKAKRVNNGSNKMRLMCEFVDESVQFIHNRNRGMIEPKPQIR